jgi:hypothetical protein
MADTGAAVHGQTASPADEQPADPRQVTDSEPESPHGVGQSVGRRGEDVVKAEGKEPGRHDTGREGEADRPTGTSDERDISGV